MAYQHHVLVMAKASICSEAVTAIVPAKNNSPHNDAPHTLISMGPSSCQEQSPRTLKPVLADGGLQTSHDLYSAQRHSSIPVARMVVMQQQAKGSGRVQVKAPGSER